MNYFRRDKVANASRLGKVSADTADSLLQQGLEVVTWVN